MIHNLCNQVDENNLDTFYKILVVESAALPAFDHLTPKEEVVGILNSLDETYNALLIPLLPEKLGVSSSPRVVNGAASWTHSLSLPVVPQTDVIQALMERYNNREVVGFVTRHNQSHLYGTQAQPLLFTYSDLHAHNHVGLKGFNVSLQGETYGAALYFAGTEADFPVITRGLAMPLASSL